MSLIRTQAEKIFSPNKIGIAEFSESSDYTGKPLFPLQRILLKLIFLEEMAGWEEDILSWWIQGGRGSEILLSPEIRKRRDWLRDNGYDHFAEVDLVGGRRSAKGYVTGLAGGYKLWKVREIPDPANFFTMDIDKQIEFACIAAAFDQAKTRQFADFYSVINRCKALQPYISKRQEEVITVRADSDVALIREMENSGIKVAKDFAKFRVLPLAANADTLRGSASIVIVFDEMAFMMPGESRSSAQECYNAAEPSLAQFGKHSLVFCNPPEAPMLMGDLSFKPIGDVQIGDSVMGWEMRDKGRRHFTQSKVINVMRRESPIVRVTMESGRVFRCTPDHRWLTLSSGGNKQTNGGEWFAPPKIGRKYAHIVDPTTPLEPDIVRDAAWLAGIMDGEGHVSAHQVITIAQSRKHNPEVCAEIERVLTRLGIEWRYEGWKGQYGHGGAYHLIGGSRAGCRQMYVDLANWLNPIKRQGFIDKFTRHKQHTEDHVVSVEPDGYGEVVALTTATGNYICNGFASKNCNSSPYTRIGQFYEQFSLSMRKEDHPESWYPMRMAMQFPSWALFDKWWVDPARRFRNAIMVSPGWADQLDPEVPESVLDEKNLTMRTAEQLKEKANPDSYKVEYRAQWAEVLDAYLNPDKVDAAYNGVKPDGSPCMRTTSSGGTYRHVYLAHCDPSSTTAGFGFALGHIEEFPDESGIFPDGVARHVVFDLVKRWNPQNFPGEVINYIRVRQELTHYAQIYRPAAITFDQFNSAGLMQELRADARKLGIQNMRISEVTATQKVNWNRWEAFKTALYLGLVHIPPDCEEMERYGKFDYSDYSKQELKFLQEVQAGQVKRVEKQSMGPIQTKDIADCIAEVVVKFLGSYIGDFMDKQFANTTLTRGAEGGYPLGGRQPGGPMGGSPTTLTNRFEEFYSGRGSRFGTRSSRGIDPRRRGRR